MGNPMLILNFDFFQLQVGLQANVPQPQDIYDEDDDVDTALNDLQVIIWLMFLSHFFILMGFFKIRYPWRAAPPTRLGGEGTLHR